MRAYSPRKASLWARIARRLGPRGLVSWALLTVVLISITSGLTEAAPDLDVTYVLTVVLSAVTVGWLSALLPIRWRFSALMTTLFGAEFLLVRVGRLGGTLWQIVRAAASFVWEIIIWYWSEQPPALGPLTSLYLELWRDVATLLTRTATWLVDVVSGRGSFDVVGSAIVWGFVIWLYSVWAGWIVRRAHRPLIGVWPGSVLMSFAVSYTGSNPYIFLPVVGGSLVLMALSGERARERRWESLGIDYSRGLWSDVALTSTGISIALVILAAISPSVSVQKIADWIDERVSPQVEERTDAVAEGLGLEQKPEPVASRPLETSRVTSLPQRHLIGSGPELSRQVVMVVETGELPMLPIEELMQLSPPRHYWRSITYDYYFGRGWATSSTETVSYEAGSPATPGDTEPEHLRALRQEVRLVGEAVLGVVFVDGVLVSADEAFDVLWRPPGEIFAATTEARQYTADSVYASPTEEQLRLASAEYPAWVVERYLNLPESTPERVLALSRDLTATEPTPYDRALAIEAALREYPYTLDVPAPGAKDDIADFFLFELQEGYCDYYATSMVVLARAAGLPARLVIGYVSGSYDPIDARYVVTEADAHAWPEIYFPEYGWIEFEPTAGRAPILRQSESSSYDWSESDFSQPLVSQPPPVRRGLVIGQWLISVVGGILAVIVVGSVVDSAVLSVGSARRMLTRLYRRLRRHARKLRIPVHVGDTPYELAAAIANRLDAIAEVHGFSGVEFVEPGADEIGVLMKLYTEAWYSSAGSISPGERRRAIWLWWRLRWRLWLARLWRRSGRRERAGIAEAESGETVETEVENP